MKYCPDCGIQLLTSSKFCAECGISLEDAGGNSSANGSISKSDFGMPKEDTPAGKEKSEELVQALNSEIDRKVCRCGEFNQVFKYDINGKLFCDKCKGKIEFFDKGIGGRNIFANNAGTTSKHQNPTIRNKPLIKGLGFLFLVIGIFALYMWYEVTSGNCVGVQVRLNEILNDGWASCYKTEGETLYHKLLEGSVFSASSFEYILLLIASFSFGSLYSLFKIAGK